jgi:hypothetical protein
MGVPPFTAQEAQAWDQCGFVELEREPRLGTLMYCCPLLRLTTAMNDTAGHLRLPARL